MAALTAKRLTLSRNLGPVREYKMADDVTIFGNSLFMINSAGLATPAVAAAGNLGCPAVAEADTVNPSGGAEVVRGLTGEFNFTGVGLVQADINTPMFASDDQTVSGTQGANEPQAGILTQRVSATEGWMVVGPEASQ